MPEKIQAAELDLQRDLATYPDLQFALDYWDAKCRDRFAPARADIDPAEIVSILPRVMLADVARSADGAVDFRYRLSGTGICNVHREELTGRRPSSIEPTDYGALIDAHYRIVLERRRPMAHVIALQLDQRSASYARIILPLSSDGQTLDMLMVVDSEKQNTLSEFVETIRKIGRRR
ncbi:MAG: PAS domain-containing protein [Kiloniellaceae bacterium]